ncbi:MAG: integrin alpha [Marinicellaceae bacterium]
MKKYLLLLFMVTDLIQAGEEPVINLTVLDGTNGFVSYGIGASEHSGRDVSGIGDVNADGIDDFIINAIGTNNFMGTVYIVFGNSIGYDGNLQLADLDGSNGFKINGQQQQHLFGYSVSGVGDINNDGIDDFAVGAPGANNSSGAAYFIFGSDKGFASSIDLNLLDGLNGFVLNSEVASGGRLGNSIASAGDFNNDGIQDVIIGAHRSRINFMPPVIGAAYILYGKNSFNATISTPDLNGSNGKVVYGSHANGQLGDSLSNAGDINGDGLDDLVIGEFLSSGIDENVYVVFGKSTDFPDEFFVSSLNGNNGFTIKGEAIDHLFGQSISADFDINNDGFDDILIGAPDWTNDIIDQEGLVYIVYGSDANFPSQFNVISIDGNNGFIINGEIDGINNAINLGYAVSSIGDFNGDSIDDIVISASGSGNFFNGSCYVIFGNMDGFGASFDVNSITQKSGYVIKGVNNNDKIGQSLSRAGDINNDGIEDFIIGAPSESTNANSSGAVYTLFGQAQYYELTVLKSGNGTGVILADSGSINCGSTCADEYVNNTMVTLIAEADIQMEFVGWENSECEGTEACVVTMDKAKEITAGFINTDIVFSNGFE